MICPHCGGAGHINDNTKAMLSYEGISLSMQEGNLLGWLLKATPESPLPSWTIYNILSPTGKAHPDSYVGVYIHKLRRKLTPSNLEIINIFGRGYYTRKKEQA